MLLSSPSLGVSWPALRVLLQPEMISEVGVNGSIQALAALNRPSPPTQQYPDPPQKMPFNPIEIIHRAYRWLCRIDRHVRVLPVVAILRMLVPANGGAIVEKEWIDDRGNPSSYRLTTWVGQPPFGAEGPRGRGEHQA
ncbi:hypothetical protein F5888DRAFT_1639933 [Russula emetica]|nr:hypothetical protein F5888DRAFT_1639933 [Russula emetica]